MFRWIGQTIAVTILGIRTIPQRFGASIVALVGIAGVVVVFVSVLSIGEGFRAALVEAGSPSRAIVMRNGSESEMTSGLLGTEADIVKQAPGLAKDGNTILAASEMYVVIDLNKRATGTPANVPLRGIEPPSLAIRPEVKFVEGRALQFGTNECVVGRSAQRQFQGIEVGSTYESKQLKLKVVGVFTANGSVAESEVWADARVLQSAYRRGNSYQSVLARLDTPASLETFKKDRKSTRLNSSHVSESRMPSSA